MPNQHSQPKKITESERRREILQQPISNGNQDGGVPEAEAVSQSDANLSTQLQTTAAFNSSLTTTRKNQNNVGNHSSVAEGCGPSRTEKNTKTSSSRPHPYGKERQETKRGAPQDDDAFNNSSEQGPNLRFFPNKDSHDFKRRYEYIKDIVEALPIGNDQVIGISTDGSKRIVCHKDCNETLIQFNLVESAKFKHVFVYIRQQLRNFGLDKAEFTATIKYWMGISKRQKYGCPYSICGIFHREIISKMLEFENSKKNSKQSKAVKTIREGIVRLLDEIAENLGYCCSSRRRVFVSGDREPKIRCKMCWKRFHSICILYNCLRDGPNHEYVCDTCCSLSKVRTTISMLQEAESSKFIEAGINKFLKEKLNIMHPNMIVRLFACIRRSGEMSEHDAAQYPELQQMISKIPHTFKLYGVTQTRDGIEILIFMLAVNEYNGEGVPKNKRGTTSIMYLDTVKYFEPKNKTRDVNHELLKLYLQYVAGRGFVGASIYVSAPTRSSPDLLFYCRPTFKGNLPQDCLYKWYNQWITSLVEEMKHKKQNVTCRYSLDPFKAEGCSTIKELCEKLYTEDGFFGRHLEKALNDKKIVTVNQFKTFIMKASIENYECQFYICFESNKGKMVRKDEDPVINSVIANTTTKWFATLKEKNWQFNEERHANYSTMIIASTLIDERSNHNVGMGISREGSVETGYHRENEENLPSTSSGYRPSSRY